jgi:signal transduction histidine kinase
VLLVVLYRALTKPILARIAEVRLAASAIGRGALDTRLPVQSRDELGLLMANVNRMAARLSRREEHVAADRAALESTVAARTADLRAANARLEAVDLSRRRFFADVSHELRTPLTVILGECDIAMRASARAADPTPAFTTIRKRAQRLKRRVEDLLRVARSESGEIELDRRPLSVAAVLAEAVDTMGSEAARRRVALDLAPGAEDIECVADREWLRQTAESLIDNALRHATGLTRIEVAVTRVDDAFARITVSDDGPGFGAPEAELMERFKRGAPTEGAPAPDETGFGIGLALARWIVEQHGGTIHLGTAPSGRGACVSLDIPASDPAWSGEASGEKDAARKLREPAA